MRLTGLAVALAIAMLAENSQADRLAREAAKAEKAGETVRAYLLYAQATVADRNNRTYWAKAQSLRPKAEAQTAGRLPNLELQPEGGPKVIPGSPFGAGAFTAQDLQDLERMTPPPRLRPTTARKDFHLNGDPKSLFEQVGREFGYTVIFDTDYAPPGKVRFTIADANYRDALHALEQATNSFIVPIAESAMLVAQDTPQKRTELENDEAQAIPIPERTSVQEAQELLTMVQQAFEMRRAVLDPQRRMILLRDRVSKVEAAMAVLNQLSVGKAQISLEVEFLATSSSSSLSFGMTLPTQFPLVDFGSILHSSPLTPAGFMRFLTFGAGKTFLGIGITDAQLFATATRSSATSLLHSTLRASDGQPASLHIGDKYPIVSAGYFGVGNSAGGGGVGTPGGVTYAVISTTPYVDIVSSAVSTTGKMKLVVNGLDIPFIVPPSLNNLVGVQQLINSLQVGVYPSVVQRGTNTKPVSLILVASTLGVTTIQLVDDPGGANIQLTKPADVASAITVDVSDATQSKVSNNGTLSLAVDAKTFPLTLTSDKNTLNGLRDAINAANAGVTASVLLSNALTGTVYMQLVASDNKVSQIQLYDDPTGANTPLLTPTDQVNQAGSQFGNTVNGARTSTNNIGQVYTPPPTFTFEDLGLILKVTPTVHNQEEVSLDVEAEYKALGGGSFNGVPVIATRKFQGKVRLRTTEWAVIAGLVTDSQTRSITGIPGLAQLPKVGVLLRGNKRSKDDTDFLLVIKPHITSLPATEFPGKTLWVGSETRPLTPL